MKRLSFVLLLTVSFILTGCAILLSPAPPVAGTKTAQTKIFNVQNLSNIELSEVHDSTFAVWERSTNDVYIFNQQGDLVHQLKVDDYYAHNVLSIFEDRLGVLIDKKIVLIDSRGKVIECEGSPTYFNSHFIDGLAIGSPKGVYGCRYYDRDGRIVNRDLAIRDVIHPLKEGRRLYRDWDTSLYGFVDENAEVCIPAQFEEAHSFSEGLAVASSYRGTERLWGFIDFDGNWVIAPKFTYEPDDFHEGLSIVRRKDGLYVYIDKTGEVVSRGYRLAKRFYNGVALVQGQNVDMINHSFSMIKMIQEGYNSDYFNSTLICENTQTIYHNWADYHIFSPRYDKVLLMPNYSSIDPFYTNVTRFSSDKGGRGYIDLKGEFVLLIVESQF